MDPWLTSSVDAAVLLQGVQDLVSTVQTGTHSQFSRLPLRLTDFGTLVPGLVMISPDNTTTITNFVKNYAKVRSSSVLLRYTSDIDLGYAEFHGF